MKAIQLTALHQPLKFTQLPDPDPASGEVVIDLRAAALNHRDVFIQQGLYPGIILPSVPGSDGAGVVSAVGEDVDPVWLGHEVLINPGLHWGDNPSMNSSRFKMLGMPDNGTFAQKVVVPVDNVYAKPTHLTFEQAAAFPLAGLTAWRALMSRAGLKMASAEPSERVLITGAGGGAALFAIQFAVATGAEVWVTAGSDDKLAQATRLGAKGGVAYKEADWHKTLLQTATDGDKALARQGYFDVIIDSAGGPGFGKLVQVAAPAARIAIFGGTTGKLSDVLPSAIFFKQLNIFGTTMGTPNEFAAMLAFVDKHQLFPVIDSVRPLADAQLAYDRMNAGQQLGKLVLSID